MYKEVPVFFEQEIEDQPMHKRDLFMTLPLIVQAYFKDDYFEQEKQKNGLNKLDVKDTVTRNQLKNEIKYTFLEKLKTTEDLSTKYPELFNLIPLFRQQDYASRDFEKVSFYLEFRREKEKDTHKNVQQKFRQFGIANVEEGEKKTFLESPMRDESWPPPYVLINRFKTEINPERQHLRAFYSKTHPRPTPYKPAQDRMEFQFYTELQNRVFKVLTTNQMYRRFFFNSLQQVMLDTPRLSFEKLITNTLKVNEKDSDKTQIKQYLQRICDTALSVYLKRNSAYIYIQCMGTQMRFFVEQLIEEDYPNHTTKSSGSVLQYFKARESRIAEKAFAKFTYFHEVILPVAFYSNTAQVQILAQVTDELLFFIDAKFYNQMEGEILTFMTNEILDLFCSYEDRRVWDSLRDILFRYGSQSEESISNTLWKTNNDHNNKKNQKPKQLKDLNYGRSQLCKSARLIICFVLTILSHFKEEARKSMIDYKKNAKEENEEEMVQQMQGQDETLPLFSCFEEGKEQKQTFEEMVLKSIKFERLEFETLGLERIIFARNTVEDLWVKDSKLAFFGKQIMDTREMTAQEKSRNVPMYAYCLPGSHLTKYLYKMFEQKRIESIQMKTPQKKGTITKFRQEVNGQSKRVDIVNTWQYTYQFGVFQGLIKFLEAEILKDEKDQNQLLNVIFSKKQLQNLKIEYKGKDNTKPKLQILASFVLTNYKCSGADQAPVCLFDYTLLSVLNDRFVFSVPTATLVQNSQQMNTESKKEKDVKLTKGTNLTKLIDFDYLEYYGNEKQGKQGKDAAHEKVVPISQGYHLCHDKIFIEQFSAEFNAAEHLHHEAVNKNDLGKVFGAEAYYEKEWFTSQECQEQSLTKFMNEIKQENQPCVGGKWKKEQKLKQEKEIKAKQTEAKHNLNTSEQILTMDQTDSNQYEEKVSNTQPGATSNNTKDEKLSQPQTHFDQQETAMEGNTSEGKGQSSLSGAEKEQ